MTSARLAATCHLSQAVPLVLTVFSKVLKTQVCWWKQLYRGVQGGFPGLGVNPSRPRGGACVR